MSALAGPAVGAVCGLGLVLVFASFIGRRAPTLEQRVVPYLPDGRLGAPRTYRAALGQPAWSLDSVRAALGSLVDKLLGGGRDLAARLDAVGDARTPEQFRADQAMSGAVGLLAGVAVSAVAATLTGALSLTSTAILVATGVVLGVLAPDWRLTKRTKEREASIAAEVPVVAELMALAMAAGEGVEGALNRVQSSCSGVLATEFRRVLVDVGSGARLSDALRAMSARTQSPQVGRLVETVVVAMDKGTPLAGVLRLQAADVAALRRQELLEEGGRRAIAMLVPVVFLVLPVTVLFAMYPGLVSIVQLAS